MFKSLSTDQRLLYEYVIGIAKGEVAPRFVARKIGPACHARWLTFAIRVLSFYVRNSSPDDNLKKLVDFICKVYAPSWFLIKKDKKLQNKPKYLFFPNSGNKKAAR